MKPSEWARREGIQDHTARKSWKQGTIRAPARQNSTGTILVDDHRHGAATGVALHARVSSSDQRETLTSVRARLYGRRRVRRALEAARQAV